MSIEDVLRRKALSKAEEERKNKEVGETTDLRNKQEEKQRTEERHILGIRESITSVDSKTTQMQALLDELTQAHEHAKGSLITKEERQELKNATGEIEKLFTNDEFRDLLAEEGIHSVEDLLRSADYAEQKEVQAVKGHQESHAAKSQSVRPLAKARRSAKEKAGRMITTERPGVQQKLTYKDIVIALEELIRDMGQERQKLYYQTPEGQEAKYAEVLDRVSHRHERHRSHFRLASSNEISNRHTVTKEDITDAEKYGDADVKKAIKNYYGKIIDGEFAEENKRNGQSLLQEALNVLDGLPKQWEQIHTSVYNLKQARQETITQLAELLGNDIKAPLYQKIKDYGNWSPKDPEELARFFIDSLSENNGVMLDLGMGTGTTEKILEKTVSEQANLAQQITSGATKNIFSRTDVRLTDGGYNYATALENPTAISLILAEQEKFYKKLQASLTTPEEVVAKMQSHNDTLHAEIKPKSAYELGIHGSGPIKKHLEFDGKTYATLRDTPLSKLRDTLKQQRSETEKMTATLKEQIVDSVETDWAKMELSNFEGGYTSPNYRTIQEAERIIKMQAQAERLKPKLDLAVAEMSQQLEQSVSVQPEGNSFYILRFDSVRGEELLQLDSRILELKTLITGVTSIIEAINQRAVREGDGMIGGKKRQRDKEKSAAEAEKKGYEDRLQKVITEYEPKNYLDKKLAPLRQLLHDASREHFKIQLPRHSVPLKELVAAIEDQMNFRLTPEQSAVYERHQELVSKKNTLEKEYDKKWKN